MTTDTRSIGQVLFETLYPREKRHVDWWLLPPATHERWERDAEPLYKRGFDAGQANPKLPTPRAKEYRDALKTCVEAAKRLVADAVSLAESGDAGCWDPDDDETIQAGRDAIAKAEALLR